MSEKNNAACTICGKKYQLCATCASAQSYTGWRKITDTTNCYKLFILLQQYTNKRITAKEAKAHLNGLDLTELSTFLPHVKQAIDQINNE